MFRVPPRAAPSAVPLRAASSLPAPPPPEVPPPFVSAVPHAASTIAAAAPMAVSDALVLLIDSSSSDRPPDLANRRNPRCSPRPQALDRDQRVMMGQWPAWRHRGAPASGPPSSEPGPIDV